MTDSKLQRGSNDMTAGWSMRLRVLVTGATLVIVFMLLTGLVLERAFRSSAMEASNERLQARIYMLFAAAEIDEDGSVIMPSSLPDPRLAVPNSGVLAAITNVNGTMLWRSESSLAATPIYPHPDTPGQATLGTTTTDDGLTIYSLSYPLIWELESGTEYTLIFHAAEDAIQVEASVAAFRDTLQLWLGSAALCLLLLQTILLVWVMKPLRQVASEVHQIEAGQRKQLAGDYPRELRPLTDNLNAILLSNQARLSRYRDALADLAHGLKTPLAVLRASTANSIPEEQQFAMHDQLDRMDDVIVYQLQRAAASGRSPLTAPVCVAAATLRIVTSLEKVYHDKHIRFESNISNDVQFIGDPGDLAEILGNLADNACKWCDSHVRITATNTASDTSADCLVLTVEDDGAGIPEELQLAVTQRGMRADSGTPGQGIGLAVVRDIVVELYGGKLAVDTSDLGGARIQLRL